MHHLHLFRRPHRSWTAITSARRQLWGGPTSAGNNSPLPDPPEEEESPQPARAGFSWGPTLFKMFESAATTLASITVLGFIGFGYTHYYKHLVLKKIDNAFKPGDPVLDLAGKVRGNPSEPHWIIRHEQAIIDAIIDGTDQGHYFLLIGEKGTGKSSMLIEAMQRVDGQNVSMFDAHADIEIFRIRLGKALDFEYHEDNIGSLFSIRGPRESSALLDIERAFNKFEKVALNRRNAGGRPLIIVINSMHLLRDDDDGRDLLELIQQRAEQWCASKLCTIVFNSDDYWVYERLKQYATRMEVVPVLDLAKDEAIAALSKLRYDLFQEQPPLAVFEDVFERVGGRLAYLTRVAKSKDMLAMCDDICLKEKNWFLSKCGMLGEEMDDDVMDQQKYASAAMVLARALVQREKAASGQERGLTLPMIPLHEARQIMTRADFIQSYDQINIFTINDKSMVRADSVPMQRAFRQICAQEGFDEYLQATLDRISAIESLGRTRELTIKDLWNKGKYSITSKNGKGQAESTTTMEVVVEEEKD